ncbi:hypothetical protein K2Z84_24755, partial [Candidatus Binatia bacterium]|nr:hypothetical protein [Candidatus Binatia bacterium]
MPADEPLAEPPDAPAPRTREAWRLVRTMLDDLTRIVEADAESDLELMEGMRALARMTALCSEATLDADHELPSFRSLTGAARLLGCASPLVTVQHAPLDGRLRYRVRGRRGGV